MKRAMAIAGAAACLGFLVASGAWAYEATMVTNGGTIKGTVTFQGTPPTPQKIEVTKDTNVCGAEGAKVSEALVVGPGGGIANVVVRLAGITKGAALASPAAKPTLDQKVCQFRPHVVMLPAGSALSVINSDGILHNVHTYGEANPPINKAQPGFKKQIELQFDKPEFPIRVECDAHPWMKGWIVVQDHPYYAVTDQSGGFTLSNVPPGDYDLEAWQETLGRKTAKVSVPADGTANVAIVFAAN
jgi:plastocyanin